VEFLQQIESGLAVGALYGLIAIGYTMVYGIVQLINFAHGEIFMTGGMGALLVYMWLLPSGTSLAIALPLMLLGGMLTSTIIAVGAERLAYRPLRTAPRLAPLITAIGLSFVLQQIVFLWMPVKGANSLGAKKAQPFPQFGGKPFTLGSLVIQRAEVLTIVVAIVCMAALGYFVYRTRTGRAMQATSQDPDTARLMGIDTDKMIVLAFAIGAALAAVAALCYGLKEGSVNFDVGFLYGLKAFTAAVLGGIGNVYGAMLGGVVLGIVESLIVHYTSGHYFGGSAWRDVWAFALLIVVLLIRPQGLLGERVADRA
jgi:branched-chain amino acid transport system permease protein